MLPPKLSKRKLKNVPVNRMIGTVRLVGIEGFFTRLRQWTRLRLLERLQLPQHLRLQKRLP